MTIGTVRCRQSRLTGKCAITGAASIMELSMFKHKPFNFKFMTGVAAATIGALILVPIATNIDATSLIGIDAAKAGQGSGGGSGGGGSGGGSGGGGSGGGSGGGGSGGGSGGGGSGGGHSDGGSSAGHDDGGHEDGETEEGKGKKKVGKSGATEKGKKASGKSTDKGKKGQLVALLTRARRAARRVPRVVVPPRPASLSAHRSRA